MRKVITSEQPSYTVLAREINGSHLVLAKKKGDVVGMVIKVNNDWILRTGCDRGATGWHPSLEALIKSCEEHGYEFFTP